MSLSEKLYLLAIRPHGGGIIFSASNAIRYVLAGALLFELAGGQYVRLEGKTVHVLNSGSREPLYQFILGKLSGRQKQMKIQSAISRISWLYGPVRRMINESLVRKRIIRLEKKRFLFFKWQKPVLIKRQTIKRLQMDTVKLVSVGTTDEQEVMLLSLLPPAGLLKVIFPDREKRKSAQLLIKKLAVQGGLSENVSAAIAAANAVAVAVTTAAVSAAAVRSR